MSSPLFLWSFFVAFTNIVRPRKLKEFFLSIHIVINFFTFVLLFAVFFPPGLHYFSPPPLSLLSYVVVFESLFGIDTWSRQGYLDFEFKFLDEFFIFHPQH